MRKTVVEMPPFYVMEVLELAEELERSGNSIIHLEVGELDIPTPQYIRDAGIQAISEGKTGYTSSTGIKELREAISEDYEKRYGVYVSPEQIIVADGSSPGLLLTFSVLLEEGDEAILSDPCYACYPNMITFLGCKPVFIEVYEEDSFQFKLADIEQKLNPRVKAVVINSPANPTGHLLNSDVMKKIAELGPTIISDEIYHGLVYG